MAVYNITVTQLLPLIQGLGSNPSGQQVTQTLVFTETVKIMPLPIGVEQTLHLAQIATCRYSIRNITVTQGLELQHSGAKNAAFEVFTQFLHMWQSAKVIEFEQLSQTLVITQTATAVKSKGTSNTLTMTQTATYNIVRNLTVVDLLTLSHGASGYKEEEETYSVTIPAFTGPNAPEC